MRTIVLTQQRGQNVCRNTNDKDDPVGEESNNDDDERSDQG